MKYLGLSTLHSIMAVFNELVIDVGMLACNITNTICCIQPESLTKVDVVVYHGESNDTSWRRV